jgi:plasmid stability protein
MAGFQEIESAEQAHRELLDAGLTREELARRYAAEVDVGSCTMSLRRRKDCWSVRVSAGLPYQIARKLNEEWGRRIRVRGAGWNTPLKEGEAVLLWEVDDPEALRVLIRTLRDHFQPPRTTR